MGRDNPLESALRASTEMAKALDETNRMVEAVRANSAAVLRAVKAYRQFTDAVLAMRSAGQMSRASVSNYMTGRNVLTVDKMAMFAEALAMPPRLFFDQPDDALRWVIDHSPNPNGPDTGGSDEDEVTGRKMVRPSLIVGVKAA